VDLFTKAGGLPRGRPFGKGNPGRKPGSKNKATLVSESLLQNEGSELVRKAVELAKAGDVAMLKFLLTRLLPKERPVNVNIPQIDTASDATEAFAAVIDAVSSGQVAPHEGAALGSLISAFTATLNVTALEARLAAIEKNMGIKTP
jgi:hypothetical protein